MEKEETQTRDNTIRIILSGLNKPNDNPNAEAVRDAIDSIIKIMKTTKKSLLVGGEDIEIVLTEAKHSSPAEFAFAYEGIKDQESQDEIIQKIYNGINSISNDPYSIRGNLFARSIFEPLKNIAEQTKTKLKSVEIKLYGETIHFGSKEADKLENFSKHYSDIAISSFSGVLEVVNLHGGEKKFTIYTVSGYPIKCTAKDNKRNIIAKLVDKFVRVTGTAKYDIGSFIPKELTVDKVEEVTEPTTDPFQNLKNSVDLGEELPHEYVNKLREDWL